MKNHPRKFREEFQTARRAPSTLRHAEADVSGRVRTEGPSCPLDMQTIEQYISAHKSAATPSSENIAPHDPIQKPDEDLAAFRPNVNDPVKTGQPSVICLKAAHYDDLRF